MKNTSVIITILIAVIVGAGAFFAGMKYQQTKMPSRGQFQGGQANRQGVNGQGRFANGARPVNGEIISADDKSITVKMQDGSSKIVLINDNTSINKSDQASKSDLKTGERVAVFGMENSDGSVTAQNIQLNPMFRGNPGEQK